MSRSALLARMSLFAMMLLALVRGRGRVRVRVRGRVRVRVRVRASSRPSACCRWVRGRVRPKG